MPTPPDGEALARAREGLTAEKRRLVEEIRSYPTPITACDAQFNRLLEERASVSQRLSRLETAPAGTAEEVEMLLSDVGEALTTSTVTPPPGA